MDLRELIDSMNTNIEGICKHLYPQGKIISGEYCIGDVSGSPGKSMRVSLSKGVWSDFADSSKGGDIFDLWKASTGSDTIKAMNEVKDFLGVYEIEPYRPAKREYKIPQQIERPIKKTVLDYLRDERKITDDAINAYKVSGDQNIFFPYYKDGQQVNHKIRTKDKKMKVATDAEPCLFGWQVVNGDRSIVICEGELDALSWYSYGFKALSVPFGAGTGNKNRWIENDWELLDMFDTIHISMDMDKPGQEAAKDIANRLGIHRCRLVNLPKNDCNECLCDGFTEVEIKSFIDRSKYIQHESLLSFSDTYDEMVKELFTEKPQHYSPGFHERFKNVRLYLGEVSIWAGANGHGKTTFLMQLALDLVYNNHKVCIASLEQKFVKYLKKIIYQILETKYLKKEDVEKVYEWLDSKIFVYNKIGNVDFPEMVKAFNYASKRYGVTHFIIDSLSKLGLAEDDYNSQKKVVEDLCNFSIQNNVHSHLVHHVRKSGKESNSQDKFDIKGTGAITDMAFNVFMVVRNKDKEENPDRSKSDTAIIVKKQREHGWEGTIPLNFNKNCDKFYNGELFPYRLTLPTASGR